MKRLRQLALFAGAFIMSCLLLAYVVEAIKGRLRPISSCEAIHNAGPFVCEDLR